MSLNAKEHAVMDITVELANAFAGLVPGGPTHDHDINEFAMHLHAIQNMVLSQSAARVYPNKYRLMGRSL